jgi:phosphonatase-like hydrolase
MSINTESRAGDTDAAAIRSTDLKVVVLDMAGTTVADDGLVLEAFDAAATVVGLPVAGAEREAARQYVLDTMGQSKIEVFRALFGDEKRAQTANTAFEKAYENAIDGGVVAIAGAEAAITTLRDAGVRVVLTTGFSAGTQQRILDALGWNELADLVLAPGSGGRGRPYPDLVLNALLRMGIDDTTLNDVAQVAVVGDTGNDVLSGRRAGASIVVGVLTGAHDRDALLAAGATHVLDSVAELPGLLLPS